MRTVAARCALLGVAGVVLFGAGACAGDNARGGTIVVAAGGDADVLLPPITALAQTREVTDLLFERLVMIGPDLNTIGDAGWTPRLASRWTWNADSSAVTFTLNPAARWHDSTPVRASDVAFAFSLYTDPRVQSSDGRDLADAVDSMTVSDSVTCTAWFKTKSRERFYTLVSTLAPLPEHILSKVPRDSLAASAFVRNPVGSGPFRFVKWESKQRIEIAAVNDHFLGRPNIDRVIWTITPEGTTAVQRVLTGEADFVETLTPGEVASLPQHPDISAVRLRSNVFGYLVFNTVGGKRGGAHPIFGERETRRALAMALDRAAIARNVVDTIGRVPLGPFSRLQWSADSTLRQLPFDRAAAQKTLDSLGWRRGADSVRQRNGHPLAFSILIPMSGTLRAQLAVLLQEQWRQIGANVTIERAEFAAARARLNGGDYDVTLMQLTTSPSPAGIRQAWSTAAITMATGYNLGRYSNAVVDSAIDHAVSAATITEARAHYRVAYQTLLDDAAGVWLYEPAVIAGANKRLNLATLRADAWWMSVGSWAVTSGGKSADGNRKP